MSDWRQQYTKIIYGTVIWYLFLFYNFFIRPLVLLTKIYQYVGDSKYAVYPEDQPNFELRLVVEELFVDDGNCLGVAAYLVAHEQIWICKVGSLKFLVAHLVSLSATSPQYPIDIWI